MLSFFPVAEAPLGENSCSFFFFFFFFSSSFSWILWKSPNSSYNLSNCKALKPRVNWNIVLFCTEWILGSGAATMPIIRQIESITDEFCATSNDTQGNDVPATPRV